MIEKAKNRGFYSPAGIHGRSLTVGATAVIDMSIASIFKIPLPLWRNTGEFIVALLLLSFFEEFWRQQFFLCSRKEESFPKIIQKAIWMNSTRVCRNFFFFLRGSCIFNSTAVRKAWDRRDVGDSKYKDQYLNIMCLMPAL